MVESRESHKTIRKRHVLRIVSAFFVLPPKSHQYKGGDTMNTATRDITEGEEIMTDFQFKTIIKMVLSIAKKTNDVNVIIKELEKLLPEDERDK